jgi:hypothetical protein
LKARFHISVSGARPPQPSLNTVQLGDGTSGVGNRTGFARPGFLKRVLTRLLLAAAAIAVLFVALVIGSVVALILLGILAIVVVALILRTSLRRARQ